MGTANLALLQCFAGLPDMEIDVVTSAMGGNRQFEQFSQSIRIFKVPVWNRNIHHSTNRELILYAVQAFFVAWHLSRQKRYDFCFAWSAVPAGAVALALRYVVRLSYMVWVSGPDIPGFEQRYARLHRFLRPLLLRVWKGAQPLIAKCPEEVGLIHKVQPGQKVIIIPNGVDLENSPVGSPGTVVRPLQIVCVARLIERKGQHHLIQAVKQLLDEGLEVEVKLLGTGDSLAAYQQLAAALGLQAHVRFLGYVSREDVRKYCADADVFVLPSFYEGMSLAALEAMGVGLPLVLTRTGGTEELVAEGVNGLTFDWADVQQLAAHLSLLAKDRRLVQRMGQASRQRAARYAWPAIAKEYLALFERTRENGKR
ncbi:MAG: glycosyltransferase family 4 protein [Chloroflexota bacterium]